MAFHRRGNSYLDCFYPALEALGVNVCDGEFSGTWLVKNLRNIDYVHIHWPSHFYNDPSRIKCLRNFGLFLFLLALARWRGARLLWTIHNLYPHDRCVIPGLDFLTRQLLVRMGACFFVHGPSAKAEVLREFPKLAGRVVQIEHGHWIDYYPNAMTCRTARSRLGLSDKVFAFLFIGLCKPYKNLEALIRAFEQLPGNPVLIIAGKFQDHVYEDCIKSLICRSTARITLNAGYVKHEDVQVYLRACNAVVTPYSEILTSGSAMLALSFGRPVIAPALGSLNDLVVNGCGLLYDPFKPMGLRDAMQAAIDAGFDEAQITAEALKRNWNKSAEIVVSSLGSLLQKRDGKACDSINRS